MIPVTFVSSRAVALLAAATIVISGLSRDALADGRDRVMVQIGRPAVWSRGQAHYLLARMQQRNQEIETPLIKNNALDPNAVNATRIQVIKTLLDKKLVAAAGRKEVLGRPILYKTTKEFLIHFGLKDLTELPSMEEFEELIKSQATSEETVPAEIELPS